MARTSPSFNYGDRRPHADLYAFDIRSSIPSFPLPLIAGDDSPIVDLQQLFNQVYEQTGYDFRVDYSQPIIPQLLPEDAEWVESCWRSRQSHF